MPIVPPNQAAGTGSWWVIPEGEAGQLIGQLVRGVEGGAPAAVDNGVGSLFTVTQAPARPAAAVAGPYPSRTAAQAQAAKLNTTVTNSTTPTEHNITKGLTGWGLSVSGIAPWFFRGLKILFGGVLIIVGVSKLTGADNKIVQLAGKVPVIPV
jgi:hypothetical protein